METPLVSVCMTTYNHEAYLRQAVESILAQETSFDVELVLGDDCSADSTAAICREYAAKYPGRVRFVTGQRNVGWRANYRRTFEACRGKYVAYCDGDDWWSDPRKLQMQVDLLESDPSCGMCYTRASNYYQNTGLTEPDHEEHFTDFDRLLCRLTIANCATLARRDLIARYYAEVRPDEHPEWLTDDAPMWLWFAVCSRVRYLPAITAVHRRDGREVAHTAADREPEPHRGVVGKPFGVLVGTYLGIVAGDEVAARQRGAVGDGEPAKQAVEVGKVLLVVGFGEAGVLVIVAGARIAHPARGVGLQQVDLHLQLAGVAPPVVAVAVGHVFPAAGLERAAVVGTPAHVALARDETHAAGVFRRVFAADSGRGVRTAIVAQHQFDVK